MTYNDLILVWLPVSLSMLFRLLKLLLDRRSVSRRFRRELLKERSPAGILETTGNKVGRQAQMMPTSASMRLHNIKMVKSSGYPHQSDP